MAQINKINTTQKGNDLRDRVYRLCVAAGLQNAQREYSVGGKSADVYFEDRRGFDGTKRYAVECKSYSKALGEPEFAAIYSGYISRKGAAFDRLLIISECGVTSNFREGVAANRDWISTYTWQEFLFSLIDFQNYFQSLSLLFRDDNLSQYYIKPSDVDGNDISILVEQWLNGDSNQPLAVVAGYGMGKSSLAKFLTSKMAPEFERGISGRIPVYIKLGGLFDQQNIESMLTHYFTSEHQISNMSPAIFKEMNRLGLLFIIFDGFDEMKHGMTHHDFKNIFSQIKSLVEGEARIIVLGRPSALTSDCDRAVLFGKSESSENEILNSLNDEVVFHEILIAEFSDIQLEQFVPKFLVHLNEKLGNNGRAKLSENALQTRANDILAEKFRALIRRPVHAQMLCRIALLNTNAKLTQTSTYMLYQSFVHLILQREVSKQARQAIDECQRLNFMMETAWHFWPDKGLTGFTLEQLKSANIQLPEKVRPHDDIHREMLVGSLLEKKAGSLYYFAHRSFQEYLIAEYIISSADLSGIIDKVNRDFTNEIAGFIRESANADSISRKLFEALSSLRRPIGDQLLKYFDEAADIDLLRYMRSESLLTLSPKQTFILARTEYRLQRGIINLSELVNDSCRAAALLGQISVWTDSIIALEQRSVLGCVLYYAKPLIRRVDANKDKLRNQVVLKSFEERLWAISLLSLQSIFDENKEFVSLKIDFNRLYDGLNLLLNLVEAPFDSVERLFEVKRLDELLKQVIEQMDGSGTDRDRRHIDYRKELIQFLRAGPNEHTFVDDQSRTREQTFVVTPSRKTLKLKR